MEAAESDVRSAPRVFSGSPHPALHAAVCRNLDTEPGGLDVTHFPSGNIYVEFPADITGEDVFLLQALADPVNTAIMELLVMADAARRSGAARITALLPFYAYGRTDGRGAPESGAPITARLLADLITVAGVDRVVTIDLHAPQIRGFFDIPVDELSALDLFAGDFASPGHGGDAHVVVAPHEGSTRWASGLAQRLGLPLAVVDRRPRPRGDGYATEVLGPVGGRSAILIENEIDTGKSIVLAAEALTRAGAASVQAVATHPVFSSGAAARLGVVGLESLVVTDTLPIDDALRASLPVRVASVAPLLADAILRIHRAWAPPSRGGRGAL